MFCFLIFFNQNVFHVYCLWIKKSHSLTDALRNHNTHIGKSFYAYFLCPVGTAHWLFPNSAEKELVFKEWVNRIYGLVLETTTSKWAIEWSLNFLCTKFDDFTIKFIQTKIKVNIDYCTLNRINYKNEI